MRVAVLWAILFVVLAVSVLVSKPEHWQLTVAKLLNEKQNGSIEITKVTSSGVEGGTGEFCSDFSLTKEQAQQYFEQATEVSIQEIHDKYSVLPCFVAGAGTFENKDCSWEVRAGGTGHVDCGEKSFLIGCEDCFSR